MAQTSLGLIVRSFKTFQIIKLINDKYNTQNLKL